MSLVINLFFNKRTREGNQEGKARDQADDDEVPYRCCLPFELIQKILAFHGAEYISMPDEKASSA